MSQKGGRIASLGLFGAVSLEKYANRQDGISRVANTLPTHRLEDMLNFNFANLYAKGGRFCQFGSAADGPEHD